jgi:hypothetical protein
MNLTEDMYKRFAIRKEEHLKLLQKTQEYYEKYEKFFAFRLWYYRALNIKTSCKSA